MIRYPPTLKSSEKAAERIMNTKPKRALPKVIATDEKFIREINRQSIEIITPIIFPAGHQATPMLSSNISIVKLSKTIEVNLIIVLFGFRHRLLI